MTSLVKNTPAYPHWEKIGIKNRHGICLPVFSLRSEKSCGIGEYPDLIPLFPWLKELGYEVLQLLPINDTGSMASPYSAISANSLNPLLLGLSSLANGKRLGHFDRYNCLQSIPYVKIRELKKKFLERYYIEQGSKVLKSDRFKTFVHENGWLKEYADFKKGDFNFHSFVQFLCFEQMIEVKKKAEEAGILLKGDIPILINRRSADVISHPQLFYTKLRAGAPPDAFNPKGQDWGFPLYNWEEMERENYRWWKERLQVAEQFFDLYRLDHVVGFYRIYEKKGKFHPENEKEWIPHGEKILRVLLKSTTMLPIAEDLGIVPQKIKKHLNSLGICGTKVIRWEKEDEEYIPYKKYTPLSMTTLSTHDTDPFTAWWQKHPEDAKLFSHFKGWRYQKVLSKEKLFEILHDSHHTPSLFHINLLQEYLELIPGMTWGEDRINKPGVRTKKNWAYRFKPTLEELISNEPLKKIMKACIS